MYYEIVETIHPDIENMTAIDWLWPGYLARGHVHILAGDPGCGKTQIALNLAAIISQEGRKFPCGQPNPKALNTFMWSNEDNFYDTITPRLLAAGCNVSNFHYINNVNCFDSTFDEGSKKVDFNPTIHLPALEIKIGMTEGVGLVIIDPIANMITGEGNSNPQVRNNLSPLVKFAQKYNVAVLGIHHFSKGGEGKPLQSRVNGSIAMAALARIVLVADIDRRENAPTKYVFGKAKANITSSDEGFGYDLKTATVTNSKLSVETRVVGWGQELDMPLSEILGSSQSRDQIAPSLSKIQQAADLILETLKTEPKSWLFLSELCEKNKIGGRTARIARDRLRSGNLIEIEYGKGWGQSPKWQLKISKTTDVSLHSSHKIPDNTATSYNLLDDVKLLNQVNTEGTDVRFAETPPPCQPLQKSENGAIYSAKSAEGIVYNEPFENNEEVH